MGTWEGMHSQQLRPEIKNSVRMSTFISAGHRRLMLLHSPPPVAAPSSGSDVSRLPLHISHPIFTFHGHFMVVLIVLILITYIFMAIVSFRRRFSMRSGGNVGALIVTSHSSQGLDPEAIDKLPIAVFYRSENVSVGALDSKGLDSIKGDPSQASKDENNAGPVVHHSREWKCLSECAICLSDFKEQECIRMLPKCQHCFHKECIQSWLGSHSTCPLCRSNLLSLPKAVSLSSDTTSSSHGS